MPDFHWDPEKGHWLRHQRHISFVAAVFHIEHGGLLDIIEHPNQDKYPNQRLIIVEIDGYAWIVPYVENDDGIFLKTMIPSRKMTRLYLGDA